MVSSQPRTIYKNDNRLSGKLRFHFLQPIDINGWLPSGSFFNLNNKGRQKKQGVG
jgi:hypothetical protein